MKENNTNNPSYKTRREEFSKELRFSESVKILNEEEQQKIKRNEREIKKEKRRKQRNRRVAIGIVGMAGGIVLTITGYKIYQNKNQEPTTFFMKDSLEKKGSNREKEQEKVDIKKEVEKLETKEDVLKFLKNMYIEQYEIKTGDTSLTTKDINIYGPSYQDSVFMNQETGDIITHGEFPNITKQKLEEDNISYEKEYNVAIYKVQNKDGKVIDGITLKNGVPHKVIMGDQYDESYPSILVEMGQVIPRGLDYANFLDIGDNKQNNIVVSRVQFINSLEEFEKNQNIKIINVEDEMEY